MPAPYPTVYEVFARVWIAEASARAGEHVTLATLPDADLDRLAAAGFDHVWLMGVWTVGALGPAISRRTPSVARDLDEMLPGWKPADVVGSPYAVARYAVDPAFGGDAALAELRARLARRSIKLILDFIPNHTARDHHWIREAPELYVRAPDGDLACGKDPNFPAWTDTAQLDVRLARTHELLLATLRSIAERADGVRCDMCMLLLTDVFAQTWAAHPPAPEEPLATGELWAELIDGVRAHAPGFLMIAEAYWGLEARLQRLGFDYTYDKTLYDRLVADDPVAVRTHLGADLEYQARSLRFLENHDEPRLAALLPLPRREAALTVAMTVPGMRLVHDGQRDGRRVRSSIFVARRLDEELDPASRDLHDRVLALLRLPALREGAYRQLAIHGVDAGPGAAQLVAHRWEHPAGSLVIVVNLGPERARARVVVELHGIEGRTLALHDRVAGVTYQRDGSILVDPARGLYVDLAPWQCHVFELAHRT